MKRIVPKLFGLAIVAGAASFILAIIAKLLIGATFVGLVAYYIKSQFKNYQANTQLGHGDPHLLLGNFQPQQFRYKADQTFPFGNPQHRTGIIPIN